MIKVRIYVNNSLDYSLKENTHINFRIIKEGMLNISIDKKGESEITIKSKCGNEYYFKCDVEKGLWFGNPNHCSCTNKSWNRGIQFI